MYHSFLKTYYNHYNNLYYTYYNILYFTSCTTEYTPYSFQRIPPDEHTVIVDHGYITIFYDTCHIPLNTTNKDPNYDLQLPLFTWRLSHLIKKTYELTTQYIHIPMSIILKTHHKLPNLALNSHHRNEPDTTDKIYSNTPVADSVVKYAQIFVGCITMVADVYPMKTDTHFINILEDNIREWGATNKIVSGSVEVEVSKTVIDILHTLCILSFQSEVYHQHQYPAE